MESVWERHWWAFPIWLLGICALLFVFIYARRNPNSAIGRLTFFIFPGADSAKSRYAARMRYLCLVVVVLFMLFIFGG
jgi:hypothetical protein